MSKEQFIIAMRFLASSVSVISTKDQSGNLYAMTASSVTSLTIDPASVLVCVNNEASIHDALIPGAYLCINILQKNQQEISNLCSSKQLESQRFENDFWDSSHTPFIQNAQSNIFCKVDKLTSYHTHTIVVGLVEDANHSNEISTLTYVDGSYK